MQRLMQDLRYALRVLVKNRAFTTIAVLTLALGIGASTAIFTLVDAVLLRPLPYKAPQELVWITEETTTGESTGVSWLNFQDWKRLNTSFDGMAGYRDARMTLDGVDYPELISGRFTTAGYFELMGVAPLLGRTLEPGENTVGGPNVAILSYEFWQERFAGSPQALGKTLRLNGKSFSVVGVMPRGFGAVTRTAVWAPFEPNVPKPYLSGRDIAWLLFVAGRTKPGISFELARKDMDRVGDLLAREYPASDATSRPVMKRLTRQMLGDNRAVILLLAAAVALLFFITCMNLASLLLVKTHARQREFAVRLALGAGKREVSQQLFVEGLLLALAGGGLGWLVADGAVKITAALLPNTAPLSSELQLSVRALLFLLTICVAASFALGFAPARFATRANLPDVLRSASYRVRGGRLREHAVLMICEVGLAMAVLVGTGLLARTLMALIGTDIGFDASHLLGATVTFPSAEYPNPNQTAQFMDQGIERIEQLPGVKSAAAVFPIPFTPQIYQVWLAIEGRVPQPGVEQACYISVVSSRYLETMKIAVLQGRPFFDQDRNRESGVVVIDRTLARRYWPDQNPIGKSLKLYTEDFSDSKQKPYEVIGVVAPVRAGGLDEEPQPRAYVLMNQIPNPTMSFVVRTEGKSETLALPMQETIRSLNRKIPIFGVGTMEQAIRSSQGSRRLAMLLLVSFSSAALILAAMGLYGVVSQLVEQRTNEIGIRVALGARPGDIARLILKYGGALVAGGVAVGIPAALAMGQLMRTLLYGVSFSDAVTFAAATLTIVMVTLAACYLPIRRAVRVDPMVALRYE